MTTQIGFLQGLIKERVYITRDLKASLTLVAVSGNDYGTYTSTSGSEQVLKLIHDTGVRRVLVTSLQPVGCLPRETVFSSYKQCNESRNTAASFHNQLLQQAVTMLNNNTKDSSFLILDMFSAFNTALKSKKDFREKA
ncbi:putative chlorogenate--glucarate O-hydroxycinnamoyltransferase [Helianthus debilis subsp. tardiflorus]